MKKIFLFVMLLCFFSVGTAGAVLLTLDTTSTIVDPLTDFDVDLVVSGSELGNFGPDSVSAFDVDILYDTATMDFVDYQLGDFLGDLGNLDPFDDTAIDTSLGDLVGIVDLAEVSLLLDFELDARQRDSFTLATLTFQLLGPDSSIIAINGNDPNLYVTGGFEVDPESPTFGSPTLFSVVVGDPLTIAPVPEPATMLLLGLGLAGLAGFRKKFKKT